MKKYLIIVAGGSGSRLNSDIPKQFIPIAGKPIIMHAVKVFTDCIKDLKIIIVLPKAHIELWSELCREFSFDIEHSVVEGGPKRYHSVKNGLKEVKEDCIVAIHDGARPLVNKSTILNTIAAAESYGAAIPVVKVNESVREITGATTKSINRENLRLVQTPQCFKSDIIFKAYKQNYKEEFTDDANVVENDGQIVHIVEGNVENIKITYPGDIFIAEVLLKRFS
ncbi:MAG: 2-C-methyl-D-erythritol 4-phosphate cytidylyltransferase [Saprospiraceae bacterium]|nr:2-C-methyl-D-erythritol 4-phosphate cytidylyltransferase [Saprospiraceae bacterium]